MSQAKTHALPNNLPLIFAAVLSFLMLMAHALTGENAILLPLYASNLSDGLKALVSALWHGTTLILVVNTLALLWVYFRRAYIKPITLIIGGQYFALACVFLSQGLIKLGSVMVLTQWILGFCIAALCLWAFTNARPH